MPEEESPYLKKYFKDLEKEAAAGSERYAGTDIAAGIISGLLGAAEGTAEMLTIPVDYMFGTKYSREINEFVDEIQDYTGLRPTGGAGEAAEAVGEIIGLIGPTIAGTIFGGGVGGAMGAAKISTRIGKLAHGWMQKNLGKLGKFDHAIKKFGAPLYAERHGKRVGQVVGATVGAGLADAVILRDGRTLVFDYFTPDGWEESLGKLRSESYSDELSPREDALRRIRNKLRAGAEGSMGFAALKGVGVGFKGAGALTRISFPYGDTTTSVAEQFGRAGFAIGRGTHKRLKDLAAREGEDSIKKSMARGILSLARPFGLASEKSHELIEGYTGYVKSQKLEIDALMDKAKNGIDDLLHGKDSMFSEQLKSETKHGQDALIEELKRFLDPQSSRKFEGNVFYRNKEIINKIGPIKEKIAELQKKLSLQLRRTDSETAIEMADIVDESVGNYITRSYRLFGERNFKKPSGKYRKELVGKLHKLIREGINPNATLGEAEGIAKEIWKGNTFTNVMFERSNLTGEALDESLKKLRDVEVHGELDVLPTHKGLKTLRKEIPSEEVATGGGTAGVLRKKHFVDPVLREIYGEYTHPQSSAMNTIRALASHEANLKFMNDLADMDELGMKALDGKPMVITLTEENLKNRFYKQVPETDPLQFGKLSGKLLHKSIADEVLQIRKVDPTIGDKILGALFTMKGGFQASKTMLSPLTGFGNVISNIVPTAARMNFHRDVANMRESMGLVMKQIIDQNSPEDKMKIAKMLNLNLADSVADLNQSLALLEEGLQKGNFSFIDSIGRALRWEGDAAVPGGVKDAVSWFMKKAQEVYRGEDDIFKFYNYFAERAKYSEIFPWLDRIPLDSSQSGLSVLDAIAAGNTRAMLPSFDRMPRIMKHLRKVPFVGNFSSFAAESIRTSFNGLHMGLAEMAGHFRYKNDWIPIDIFRPGREKEFAELAQRLGWMRKVGDKQAPINLQRQMFRKAGNQFMNKEEINAAIDAAKSELQRVGTRSVFGNLAAQSSMAYSIPKIGSMVTGISKDEVDSFKRDFAMSWDANGSIVPIGRRHDGGPGFEYVNLAPINYYTTMQSTVKAFFNEWDRNANEGRGNIKTAINAASSAMLTLADPFIGLSVPIEKLVDIGARGGRTREGSIVFREEDHFGTTLAKSLAHVMNAYVPGLVPLSVTWQPNLMEQIKKEKTLMETFQRFGQGVFEPGPALRGALVAAGVEGYDKDKYGWNVEPLRQFLPYMVRLRTQIADPVQPLTYSGYELSRLRRSIANEFKRTIDRNPTATDDNVLSAFTYAQKKLFDAHRIYSRKIETAKVLGMSELDIESLLKKKKIGHRNKLIEGTFPSFEMSKDVIAELDSRGMGHLVTVGMALSKMLSGLDVSETDETLNRLIEEFLYEESMAPELMPTSLDLTSPEVSSLPARPAAPAPAPAPAPAVAPAPAMPATAAPMEAGPSPEGTQVANPIILPNPKDLALAEQLQNV